jgi:hypothetical protein
MSQIVRDIVFQEFNSFSLLVAITPTPISSVFTKSDLIDSFAISVPSSAANNVFIGNQAVSTTSGLELVAGGGPVLFRIKNQVIQYDIHSAIDPAASALMCNQLVPIQGIPFIVWDLRLICLVAVAPTTVAVAPFKSMFI